VRSGADRWFWATGGAALLPAAVWGVSSATGAAFCPATGVRAACGAWSWMPGGETAPLWLAALLLRAAYSPVCCVASALRRVTATWRWGRLCAAVALPPGGAEAAESAEAAGLRGLLAASFAGVVAFASPCMWPAFPVYLTYLVGPSVGTPFAGSPIRRPAGTLPLPPWRLVLERTVLFLLGFGLGFVALGATAGVVGRALGAHDVALQRASGVTMLGFGLVTAGALPAWLLRAPRYRPTRPSPLGSARRSPSLGAPASPGPCWAPSCSWQAWPRACATACSSSPRPPAASPSRSSCSPRPRVKRGSCCGDSRRRCHG